MVTFVTFQFPYFFVLKEGTGTTEQGVTCGCLTLEVTIIGFDFFVTPFSPPKNATFLKDRTQNLNRFILLLKI